MFEVIPAIDLKNGRCVNLIQGDFDRATDFGGNPVEIARRWESAGARRIHVVDLDGARDGIARHRALVRDIARAVRIPLQLGGGLRSMDDLAAAFDIGVERAIVGTAALESPDFVDRALAAFGARLVLGLDARDGRVAVKGWVETSDVDALEFAVDMAGRGIRTIVYTDIRSDGMLAGPNVAGTARLARAVPEATVIASGGVASLDDLAHLRDAGARGAIVGRALYTRAMDLARAIAMLEAAPSC